MTEVLKYTSLDSGELSLKSFLNEFLNVEVCLENCRACPMYGTQWSCPPIPSDVRKRMEYYDKVTVYIYKINVHGNVSLKDADSFLAPYRHRIEQQMLEREKKYEGMASATIGRCTHCLHEKCTRSSNLPCRHPDLVRPSLEALGFNVVDIMRSIFGVELQWSDNGYLPKEQYIVTAIFYSSTAAGASADLQNR